MFETCGEEHPVIIKWFEREPLRCSLEKGHRQLSHVTYLEGKVIEWQTNIKRENLPPAL